jgi:hypothetical protein
MLISPTDGPSLVDRFAYDLGTKVAADLTPSYSLVGTLFVSDATGRQYGLLTVPNAMVRGVFDAMHEPGIELPLRDGRLDAHVTVFRPEELDLIGGADAIKNDRGKPFRYSLGRLCELTPDGWPDASKAWVIRVHSPELQQLRRSHGLSSLPNDGQYDFHITVAVRRKGVLARSGTAKATTAA